MAGPDRGQREVRSQVSAYVGGVARLALWWAVRAIVEALIPPGLERDEFRCVHACLPSFPAARSGRSKENGTANHAKHAKGGEALQGQDDALDLKARPAEVEQQAEMQACGLQIIQALRAMNLVDHLGYLQFDEDGLFDE